jgi:hypothetical protein
MTAGFRSIPFSGQNTMRPSTRATKLLLQVLATSLFVAIFAQAASKTQTFPLTDAKGLILVNVKADAVEYLGRRCVLLTNTSKQDGFALLRGTRDFRDGTIEAEIAVKLATPPPPFHMPGFVGIAFRARPDASRYELFYWRPGNAQSDNQAMRNHSVQYISKPNFDWHELRYDWPWIYETYAPLKLATWTKVRIVVRGRTAKLYLNGSESPSLVVNPLLGQDLQGGVALWPYQYEDAYFSNVRVTNTTPLPVMNGSDATGTWQVAFSSDVGKIRGVLQLKRDGSKVTGSWSGDLGHDRPVSGTWGDGYVKINFEAQWEARGRQHHGAVTLIGWIDGGSARGWMKLENVAQGGWTATRKP